MCEVCSNPNNGHGNRDMFHPSFAGFFSADAIEAAVQQANRQNRRRTAATGDDGEDDDDDGT